MMRNDDWLLLYRRRTSGIARPRIALSNRSIAEDAEVGDLIGLLSVVNFEGEGEFSLGDGTSEELALDEGDDTRLVVAAPLDHETKSELTAMVVFTPLSEGDPIARAFQIGVLNVIEVPTFLAPPHIIGVAQVGEVIECVPGVCTDMGEGSEGTRAYQWKDAADDSEIEGATSRFFQVTIEWLGESVYCTETATNSAGSASEDTEVIGPFDPAPGFGAGDGFLLFGEGAVTGLHMGMI